MHKSGHLCQANCTSLGVFLIHPNQKQKPPIRKIPDGSGNGNRKVQKTCKGPKQNPPIHLSDRPTDVPRPCCRKTTTDRSGAPHGGDVRGAHQELVERHSTLHGLHVDHHLEVSRWTATAGARRLGRQLGRWRWVGGDQLRRDPFAGGIGFSGLLRSPC